MASVVVGVVAAGALVTAAPAEATCASFFGIGNTAECTSSPTSVAIAFGTGAQAHADGLFGTAFSVGDLAVANSAGTLTFATAVGYSSGAGAAGLFGIATQLGPNGQALTYGQGHSTNGLGFNLAVNVSLGTTVYQGSQAVAEGIGNVALNLFNDGTSLFGAQANALGAFSSAVVLGGTSNRVSALAGGTLTLGFSIFANDNKLAVGPGPLAIVGSILQTHATVVQNGPGFNINGLKVGGAAAVAAKAAAAGQTGASPAAAGVGGNSKKTPVRSASAVGVRGSRQGHK